MTVYFIQGKLGAGKTLVTVGKGKDYLMKYRKIATNLDLDITKLVKRNNKTSFYRLPDKPRPEDLNLIGRGSDVIDEDTYGAVLLDECGTWLNTRTYRDKERQAFIDWMLHARKLGWDIYFIIQDISMIDKQIRDALCEHLVVCRRLDRMAIPFVSKIVKYTLGIRLTMPKIHTAKVHYGDSEQDYVTDRWWYQGTHLYDAYDTRQVFKNDILYHNDEEIDMRATYTMLSRWHLEGRYYQKTKFPIPRNIYEVILYPPWLILKLVGYCLDSKPARSSGFAS